LLARADETRDLVRFEKRRRAAAEVYRVGAAMRTPGFGRANDVGDERVDVARLQRRVEQASVEVAVGTDRRTERHMDVETVHVRQEPARPPGHLRSAL